MSTANTQIWQTIQTSKLGLGTKHSVLQEAHTQVWKLSPGTEPDQRPFGSTQHME